MKTLILSFVIAAASAFAPLQQRQQQKHQLLSALNMAFDDELGAQAPLGFFDPLGLVDDGDEEKFQRLRYVEIKHGRIAMLAVVGYLVQESGLRFPGNIDYEGMTFRSIPNGYAALGAMPPEGLIQIVTFIGLLEIFVMKDVTGEAEFSTDYRNGVLDYGWDTFDDETKLKKRAIELNQGRAAMMGILALMVHDQLGVSILP
jgi:hypothetical protein